MKSQVKNKQEIVGIYVRLPKELHKQAKIELAKRGISMKEFIVGSILGGLIKPDYTK